ncbi:MAG TPA: tripartite tricarboxylate transporter substrate binding protein [Bordetella sp.]|jgi:tripartite-type tricarboxylate transporter receptor subunit TctC|nr:tripartite tricarboxylate transporter substrate binding protein [Bordetella sp.]
MFARPPFPASAGVLLRSASSALGAAVLLSCAAIGWSAPAQAAYPDKPIRLIVPFSPGGGADNAARIIVPALSKALGGNIVIKNADGASGAIGEEEVARAPKDGYTLLYDATSFAINPLLRKMTFDVNRDFVPISEAVAVPNVMVVAANSPYKTFPEFIDAAKQHPGRLTFASYGPGSLAQLIGELLKKDAAIDITHIPYKGGGPAVIDVIAGRVDTFFANAASSVGSIRSGKLRALAITDSHRMEALPEVPTVEEFGYKDFSVLQWNGFFAPAGTPPDVIAKLQAAINQTLHDPQVKEQLAKLGLDTIGSTSAEFKALIENETRRWSDLIKTNHIKLD